MARGGKREGAGRPLARSWWDAFVIGQTCEVLWRQASQETVAALKSVKFQEESRLHELWDRVAAIPVAERKAWLRSEAYNDHRGDVEAWLHQFTGTRFDEASGNYESEARRWLHFPTKPRKGTRPRIIAEVAQRYGLSSATVDRLWKAYRRLESELEAE